MPLRLGRGDPAFDPHGRHLGLSLPLLRLLACHFIGRKGPKQLGDPKDRRQKAFKGVLSSRDAARDALEGLFHLLRGLECGHRPIERASPRDED